MSYFMDDDQKLLWKSVVEFCEDPATLEAVAYDNAHPGEFPRKSWYELAEMGFIGMSMPEEYGGQGQSVVSELIVNEVLGQHAYPALENLAGHQLGCAVLYYWGSEDIRKKYLVPCAKGEKVCCGAATDPAGSFNMSEWGITFKEDGDDVIVTGSKVVVTNAATADVKVIFGLDDTHVRQSRAFIVEKGMPGVETDYQETRPAPMPQDWGSIELHDVRIPKENMLVANEMGNKWIALGFNGGALMALTMSQGAFMMAMGYTSQRTNSKRPLNQLQSVAHRLADIATGNDIVRASIYTAARLWDEGRYDESARLSFMNKAFATEHAAKSSHDATVLFGAVGVTPQAGIIGLHAGSVIPEIAECPPDVLRDMIAETYGIEPVWKIGRP